LIEINLVPGSGAKKSKRRGPKMSLGGGLPKFSMPGVPKMDKALALFAGAWLVGFGLLGWMFVGGRHRVSTLTSEIEAAQLDSVRLDAAIKSQADLERRRDVVAQKVTIVQDIDAARYVWAHIADEVARAVPEYTWLAGIAAMQADSGVKMPHFSVSGRTGNNFALTKYMQQLEQSPFIRQVELKESQLIREDGKVVYSFLLEADYEVPPPDVLETVPLFQSNEAQLDSAGAAQPNAAKPNAAKPNAKPGTPAKPNTAQPTKPNSGPQATKPGGTPAPAPAPAAKPTKPGNAPAQTSAPAPVKKER